jgi:uncharacterized protein (TIGR04255 family)
MPDFFSLETTTYEDWPDFKHRFEELASAIETSIDPSVEQRVGLRFIDQISHPEVRRPQDWRRWINRSFLGPIDHEAIGDAIVNTQQLLQLDAGDGRGVILRHGCFRESEPAGRWIYLFDLDCFFQGGRPLDTAELATTTEHLHTLALQVFQAAITDDLYDYLRE